MFRTDMTYKVDWALKETTYLLTLVCVSSSAAHDILELLFSLAEKSAQQGSFPLIFAWAHVQKFGRNT